MKKKLLIATHSVFADGIKNAMELVTGEQNSVSTLCAYTNDMTEVETPIKEIIDALCDDEELIVTTDIFGGSVNNEFMKYLSKSNIHLIAGVNLPLLFELIMNLESENKRVSAVCCLSACVCVCLLLQRCERISERGSTLLCHKCGSGSECGCLYEENGGHCQAYNGQ